MLCSKILTFDRKRNGINIEKKKLRPTFGSIDTVEYNVKTRGSLAMKFMKY